ncbi:putative toxin-antitoxin system toxin component, PIN family [bacterium]|nr:putative toxin-antitoxin system toxin component, PIN family [candidate division CSSED10-310 bacterium]
MKTIVPDTNILISGILFGGKSGKIIELAVTGRIRLCLSHEILTELQGVLESAKFQFPSSVTRMIADELTTLCILVEPEETIGEIQADPDDNRVLECAVAGVADLIVSGDKHLLSLRQFRGIPIVNADEFLENIEKK